MLHPEPPDRDDGLRVLGEIEVGLDRACDIAVEPEDMVVPRERTRCRRTVQPLRPQNVQHHRVIGWIPPLPQFVPVTG